MPFWNGACQRGGVVIIFKCDFSNIKKHDVVDVKQFASGP